MAARNDTNEMTLDRIEVKMPGKYNVIFHNDNKTPIEFVVQVLINIFSYSSEDAVRLTMKIDQEGQGVAGTYIKSIADAKATLVREVAVKASYPLLVTVEKA